MAITKEKKKEIMDSLEKIVSKSSSVVFVNFHSLPVQDVATVRRSLKSENVGYLVTKKTLFKRVLDNIKTKGKIPSLEGELALAYGDDLIAPARSIYEFQKKLEGKVSIIGGIFDGEYKTKEEMTDIASIPSLDVLRGMFVNVINSPIQRFAVSLNEVSKIKS